MYFDCHLHSNASDGTLSPVDLVTEAKRRNIWGLSLTDHNGIWGLDEAGKKALTLGLVFVEGIEISVHSQTQDVHMLGYSQAFDRDVLGQGLTATRQGYAQRMQAMVKRCQQVGFSQVSWPSIMKRRAWQQDPVFVSFDLVHELKDRYHLPWGQAHQVVINQCYVPYGEWALTMAQAINLVHRARGVAILAHPGIIMHEHSEIAWQQVWRQAVEAGIDGVEVFHPFHSAKVNGLLEEVAQKHHLLITSGSDWHGPDIFDKAEALFGKIGLDQTGFEKFQRVLTKFSK